MDMRIGGLTSGMDIDKMVDKLMKAERMPLERMEQDQTELTWKRDSYRDMNKSLLDLDQLMLDMKLSDTYQSKSVSSSNEAAVTATATSDASEGSYNIEVDKLATSAVSVSSEVTDPDDLDLSEYKGEDYKLKVGNEDKDGWKFDIKEDDKLSDVLKRISKGDNDVRAFYDNQQNKIIMESTRTGNILADENGINSDNSESSVFNITGGPEPPADKPFFKSIMNMESGEHTTGSNAEFRYNGIKFTSESNTYELNGVNFEFKGKGSANLTVQNDIDKTFDSIMNFVETYNDTIETLNESQKEEKHRDYPPLTEAQKEEMSDKEIELWEEKAKSGMLRGESVITNGMYDLRRSWYNQVDTGTDLKSVTEIGITTSRNYLDGGKIEVDEAKLKKALRDNPEDVQKLFSNNDDNESRGIINRLEDAVNSTMNKIENRAGKGTSTLETYTIGKKMKDLNGRISDFEDKLTRVETRYWNEFTEMERAIQRMNSQSEQLMSQFGGGGM